MNGSIKEGLLGDEPYIPSYVPPCQHHSLTSRKAAHSIAPRITALQQRVLDYLTKHPEGATDEQLIDGTGLVANTLRPRRRELQQANIIKDSGRYALTKSGRKATVWISHETSEAA